MAIVTPSTAVLERMSRPLGDANKAQGSQTPASPTLLRTHSDGVAVIGLSDS